MLSLKMYGKKMTINFEEQLRELADYILENHLFDKYQCSLFDDSIGQPYTEDMLKLTSCGAGKCLQLALMENYIHV